jgi:hydroxymethylglutaryl-CoA lyase
LDFGSFVSPKHIPQMADTKEVIGQIDLQNTKTKLLAIIANTRGAEEASAFQQIDYLGFPFSISPTFQKRNTNRTIEESFQTVIELKNICDKKNKQSVIYISMAFGNPYGDEYDEEIVLHWIRKLTGEGIQIISLADTVGLARPLQIASLIKNVIASFPRIETGVHLHSTEANWKEKIDAALQNGCMRFDGAFKGVGGCPMAEDKLVGNMNSELMIPYFEKLGILKNINPEELQKAIQMASKIFA